MVFQLVYVSRAHRPFSEMELGDLLKQARATNQALGVSGLLLYQDQSFLQLLEGEKQVVLDLLESISADSRHHQIRILMQQEVAERLFPRWAMGYPHAEFQAAPPGFSNFLSADYPLEELASQSGDALALLTYFRGLGLGH